MNIIPANNINKSPETVNPSDKIRRFTAALSVKKPFIQNTMKVISKAIEKQTIYFINNDLLFCFTEFQPSVYLFTASL